MTDQYVISKGSLYRWTPRAESWESCQRDAYVYTPTGRIVAVITHYVRGFGNDANVRFYADKPDSSNIDGSDIYTFVDIESAKKFVENKFKEVE